MRVQWTSKALSDLVRHGFLAAVNKPAAARIVNSLTAAPVNVRRTIFPSLIQVMRTHMGRLKK